MQPQAISEGSSELPPVAGPSRFQHEGMAYIKKEEEDPTSPSYVGIIRQRDNDRYDFRNVPDVKQELDDAMEADLEHERNIDILKRHIIALRRECDTLTRERDAALRTSVAESRNLRRECDTLKRERDAALKESAISKTHQTNAEALLKLYQADKGGIEAIVHRYREEKNELEAHVRQYNPELIERQEDLLTDKPPPHGFHAHISKPPPTQGTLGGPVTRMRDGLNYLGVGRPDPGPMSHGLNRFDQFRQWLQKRPLLQSGQQGAPSGKSAVFKGRHLPAFSKAAAWSCKAPPLFLGSLHDWSGKAKQLGLLLCPDYSYDNGPLDAPTQYVWSRAVQWRACGEEEREVFYVSAGEVHYAGTYVCHTGPGMLKVHHISNFNRMGTEDIITRVGPLTHHSGITQEERTAILDLYREGTLTLQVLGLERVGFNHTLYSYLHVGYEHANKIALEVAARKREQKLAKKQAKKQKRAAKAAVQAAPQTFPQLPLPPLPVLQPPFVPPGFGFNAMFPFAPTAVHHMGGFQAQQAFLPTTGTGSGFANRPPPPHMRVPPPPSPPRRAPSELEYADDAYTAHAHAGRVKREREDDTFLVDDEREYKAAKLEDIEDELRVDDKLRVRTEEPEALYGHSATYDYGEDVYFEPYLGFKDEESD